LTEDKKKLIDEKNKLNACLERSKHGRNAKKVDDRLDSVVRENNNIREEMTKLKEQVNMQNEQIKEQTAKIKEQNDQILNLIKGLKESNKQIRKLSRECKSLRKGMDKIHLNNLIDNFKLKTGAIDDKVEDIDPGVHPKLANLTKSDMNSFAVMKQNRYKVIF
jgi:chromosome segregation ATPase